MSYALRLTLISVLVVTNLGCASVSVSADEQGGQIEATLGSGTVVRGTRPIVVTSKGFGFFRSADGISVGWLDEAKIYLPENGNSCRAVFLMSTLDQVNALLKLLREAEIDLARICVLNQRGAQ